MYLFKIPTEHPESHIGEYDVKISPDHFLFRCGKELSSSNATPRIRFSAPKRDLLRYGVLPNSSMIPLISKFVADLLTRICAKDFQLFPAHVDASDGRIDDFSLVNISSKIAAIDYTRSEFLFIPGTEHIMKVNRLRVQPSAMAGHCLAREADYMSYIWASEEVKVAFAEAGIQGCEFLAPADVRP
jgi:hypothetical protein